MMHDLPALRCTCLAWAPAARRPDGPKDRQQEKKKKEKSAAKKKEEKEKLICSTMTMCRAMAGEGGGV